MPFLDNYEPALRNGGKVLRSEVINNYVGVTANITLAANSNPSDNYLVEVTSGTPTVTLPTAVGIVGTQLTVKNSASGSTTLATTSAQTIDGSSTKTLTQFQSLTVVSNGANWIII